MKTMIPNHKYLLFALTAGAFGLISGESAIAQQKQYTEEVTVVAPYQPDIRDANKVNFKPEIKDTAGSKPVFNYEIKSFQVPTSYTPATIEAAKMAGEPIKKLNQNYLKAGLGNYWNAIGELYFNSSRSKSSSYGFHASHRSSAGEIEDYGFPGRSDSKAEVFIRKFIDKKLNLDANAGFRRNVVHYYGYKESELDSLVSLPEKEDIKQRFALFHLGGGLSSTGHDSSNLSYSGRLGFYHLADKNKTSETGIDFRGYTGRSGNWLSFSPEQRWELSAGLEMFRNKYDTLQADNTSKFWLEPLVMARLGGSLWLKAGLNMAFQGDTTTYLRVYPRIEARGILIPGTLDFYAGVGGGLEKQSFRSLSEENPFLSSFVPTAFSNTTYKLYSGFNARILRVVDLRAGIAQSHVENLAYYKHEFAPEPPANKFTVDYYEADVLNLSAMLMYQAADHFSLGLDFRLDHFNTSDDNIPAGYAWHKPRTSLKFNVRYSMQDKIITELAYIFYGKTYAPNPDLLSSAAAAREMPVRSDISLKLEYRLSGMISAFLMVNNLTNSRYYYWLGYPAQGINGMAGLAVSF